MNGRFRRDARRWQAGGITLAELESLHPGEDVRSVATLIADLEAFANAPVPDAEQGWESLRRRMDAPLPGRARTVRVRRTLVAALAAALLIGTSAAYAADVKPVRHFVDSVVDHATGLFGGQGPVEENNVDESNVGNDGNGDRGDSSPGNENARGQNGVDQGGSGQTGPDQDQLDHSNGGDLQQEQSGANGVDEGQTGTSADRSNS